MKNKYIIIGILSAMLLTLQMQSVAQTATLDQKKAVQEELAKFKSAWASPLPYDSKFGIIALTKNLNLEYPGLEKVRQAVLSEDWKSAEEELLFYFKNVKQYNKPKIKSLTDIEKEASESALVHYFRGNKDAHPLIFRGANIDWVSLAIHDGKEIKDKEWQFIFQRLLWWEALAKAYLLTEDNKYYDEWLYEMVDFAEDILPVQKDDPWYIIRGMETYYRCQRLDYVLPYFVHKEDFDSKTLLYFLNSFHMQAEHIRTVYAEDGNHLLGELSTVFQNAISFPEFKKSKDWIQDAITMIPERMFIEIYPDGMNNELIFSYHSMYLRLFADAYVKFRQYGYEDSLPEEFHERLLKMAEIYAYHILPDNTISQFGDAWKHRDAAGVFKKEVGKFASDLPYYDFVSSQGKIGVPPPKTSIAYPTSGFYFFRSEWTPDAIFLSMKNNPNYSWHSQIDNGTFELYAYGRNFMNDSGAYIYESDDPEEAKWREWFRSSVAHQTLTLNNENIKIASKHIFWKDSDNLTCLINENESYEELTHRRTTLFIDKKYFLIYDQAIGEAQGNVRVHFQFVPCEYTMNDKKLSVRTTFNDGANLLVKSFAFEDNISMEKEDGWISYKVLRKEERPAWSYEVNKDQNQQQVKFLTTLIPYKENAPDKISASVDHTKDGLQFNLHIENKKYKILINVDEGVAKVLE